MKASSSEARVTQHIRDVAKALPPGSRLPSVRTLMRELGVSPGTVRDAVEVLSREHMVETRAGLGTFVAGTAASRVPGPGGMVWQTLALGSGRDIATDAIQDFASVPAPDALVLNAGYLPEDLQALPLLAKAASRALRRPEVWARSSVEGLAPLRGWFAAETGHVFQPHEVLVCPGTQGALATTFRALALPGGAVLLESPTYVGAIAAARAAGLRVIPVPVDEHGPLPEMLETAFAASAARMFYCQPCHANPTGAVMSQERRAAVIDIVARAGAFLIEDDWARDFQLDPVPMPPPLAALDPDGHVIYLRSLTKCSAPSLRVGAVCAHGAALKRLRQARLIDDFFVPGCLQEITLQLVTAPAWSHHLRGLRASLRNRRDSLAAALRRHLGERCLMLMPSGGLHLWVRLPPDTSDREVAQQAARDNVLVSPGRDWFPAEPPESFLRLSFAAAKPERVDDGVARLGAIVRPAL